MFTILQTANGAIAVPDRNTGAYISVNPPVIGANQPLTVNMWVYPAPSGPNFEIGTTLTGYGAISGMHYANVTVTFTRPDGSNDTFMPLHGSWRLLGLKAGESDETGTFWFLYTPQQTGTWSASCSFPGQTITALNYSVYYKPSTSQTITFTVQQDPVQIGLPPVPLPTEYWSRPINAQYREWYTISGNWMGAAAVGPSGRTDMPGNIYGGFNPYTTAPNSAHILWTKEVTVGGIAGGGWGSTSYGGMGPIMGGLGISAPVIVAGKVYINSPGPDGTNTRAVDLQTGETIWQMSGSVSAGSWSPQIGASPAWYAEFSGTPVPFLWQYTSTAWKWYNAFSGALAGTINNPTGSPTWQDAQIRYVLQQGSWNPATLRRAVSNLIKWNLTKVTGNNWATGIVWNQSTIQPDGTGPGQGSRPASITLLPKHGIVVLTVMGEDRLFAFDMNTGQQLWKQDLGFIGMAYSFDPDQSYMLAYDSSNMVMHCYSVSRAPSWEKLWAVKMGVEPWDSNLSFPSSGQAFAYNNYYIGGYAGRMYCIDPTNGKIKWTFYIGNTTETPFGSWAIYNGMIVADGKAYFSTSEHTPTVPRTRGNKLFAVDAYTGKGIWNISAAMLLHAIADGYLIGSNEYDGLEYCFGKGQTETTVSAPLTAVTLGGSLTIQGTVMDLSPAQKGTPAISDEDMSAWMNYLHMGAPRPMTSPEGDSWGTPVDVKGVEVSLDALDPNGNFVHIGTVTSDAAGLFRKLWTPEVPGEYTVIATFAGSESYWSSYAETAVGVVEAPATTPEPTPPPASAADLYLLPATAGIIIAIVAVGLLLFLLLRKR